MRGFAGAAQTTHAVGEESVDRGLSRRALASRPLLLVVAVPLALMLCALLSPAVASAESLCTDTWTGPSEGTWQTAADWSLGKAPTSTDVACIGSGKTVKVTEGANQAGVVQGEGALAISGGSLEVANGLEASTITSVSVTGGALTGAGEVDVAGSFSGGQGKMEGSGITLIKPGASGSITNGPLLTLTKRTLVNEGTLTIPLEGGIVGKEGATIINRGTFTINGQQSSVDGLFVESPGPTPMLINTGTVQKTEGTGTTNIAFAVDNENTVSAKTGTIDLLGGGTSGKEKTGSWSASSGAQITFGSGTFALGSTVPLSGSITLVAATVTAGSVEGSAANVNISFSGCCEHGHLEINGGTASTIKNLTVSGTLAGTGEVDVTSSFSSGGVSGARMEGSGKTVIEPGASGTINSGYELTMAKRTLVNDASLTVQYPEGGIVGKEGATITNHGTFTINGQGEAEGLFAESPGPTPALVNTGTIQKTEGIGTTPIRFTIDNENTVTTTSGTLEFTGGGTSGVEKIGAWSASGTNGQIVFGYNGSFALGSAVKLSGPFVVIGAVAAGVVEGSTASLNISFSGCCTHGTVEISGTSPSTLSSLTLTGVLTGSGEVDVTNSFSAAGISGTRMSGSGSTVLKPGSSGTINSGPDLTMAKRTLVNEGSLTVQYPEGGIVGKEGATIINRGTFTINGQGEVEGLFIESPGPTPVFVNRGVVQKTEGTGTTYIHFSFENYDSLEARTGKIVIINPVLAALEMEYGSSNPSAFGGSRALCGKPVDCVTGNEIEQHTDIAVGGRGVGLDLTRTYNAQAAALASSAGMFGYGWSSSFSDHLVVESANHKATVFQANGSTVPFAEEGGSFVAPAWSGDTLTGSAEVGYTLTMTNQTKFVFNGSNGRLESETDRNGNQTTLGYNEKGQLATITDPAGRKIKLAYNAGGQVETAEDPMGHVVKYAYEGGNLISVTLPGETSPNQRFKYDASHRMTATINGLGGETTNVYDGSNRVTSQKDLLGHVLKFEYEPFQTKITNEATGAVTVEQFSSTGVVTSVTKGYGTASPTTKKVVYNERNEPTSITDGNGHTTYYEYSSAGDRTKAIDPNGHETKWTYNGTHDVLTVTRPNGEETKITRDEHGNATVISRPAPNEATQETKFEYNSAGQPTSMTDPLGRIYKYEYDGDGDRTAEIDPLGDKRTWTYNEDSQQVSTTSPRGNVTGAVPAEFTTTVERDAQGRPVVVSEPQASVGKPVNRVRTSISGVTLEGQTLTAAPGIWEGAPTLAYTYRWERCSSTGTGCIAISGATASTYVLGSADVGHMDRVAVTATNSSGSASSTSAVTAVVSVVTMPKYGSQFGSKGSGAGQMSFPYSIALDSLGKVWVADSANNRVDEFTSAGVFVETVGWGVSNGEAKLQVCTSGCRAGLAGTGEGEFHEPTGVAFGAGNLYVADFANNRIEEFNEKTEFVRSFGEKGTGAGQFTGPVFVTVASGGNVWVSDAENNRVDEFTSTGTFVETIGWGVSNGEAKYEICTSACHAGILGSGAGQFDIPIGIAFYSGTMYVVDNVNDRVQEFNEESKYVAAFGTKGPGTGQFQEPSMIAVESATGHLYVTDWADNRVEEFTSSGTYIGQFGATGVGNGQFNGPQGIAVTSAGNLYVGDENNGRIEEWKPVTTPTNVAVPSVSGEIVTGQTLTAGTGIWSASPAATYTYQWQRCNSAGGSCANVTGATGSTYTLGSGDTGYRLRVMVKATNTAGSTEVASPSAERTAGPHTTEYVYDGDGNVERVTDPNGHATHYVYDADNERTKVEESNGTVTETGYDGAGRVVSQTDGNKHTTKYVRNVLEQVTEIVDPLLRKTTKEYDAAGNLKKLTDAVARTTTFTYDPANRLTEVVYSDGKTPTVKYEYDGNGNRTKTIDGTGTTTYTYDQLDRLTKTENGHGQVVGYEYDLANEQTKITYPNGKTVEHTYDKAGRMEKITDWLEHTTKFSYNADSQLTATAFPTGTSEEDTYAYNNAGQMTETKMSKGTETLASLAYARDNDGQLQRTLGKGLPGKETPEYVYDENNRLAKGAGTAYAYDAANNPTTIGSGAYKYDAGSQLETGPSLKYTYNEVGERTKTTPTTGPATTYAYDQAGNLTTVERPEEGATPKIEDSYAYNGDGLRASETIMGTTHYLAWDLSQKRPLLLNDGTYSYVYGPGGVPVEQINGEEKPQYLHHDQSGSTRLITGATGTVEGAYTYTPYGAVEAHTGTASTALGYDGQYTNADTGLIYLRARAYDPATAQFMSVDPIVALTRAPYVYGRDNPLTFGDPLGLYTVGVCAHVDIHAVIQISESICLQTSGSGEVGFTKTHGEGVAPGAGASATGGIEVTNAQHLSELGGRSVGVGGGLGFGPDVSGELSFSLPEPCQPEIVGISVSTGIGVGIDAPVSAGVSETTVSPIF